MRETAELGEKNSEGAGGESLEHLSSIIECMLFVPGKTKTFSSFLQQKVICNL